MNKDEEAIRRAWNDESDLLPNAYEGGLKTWECSLDLVSYLSQLGSLLEEKRVLEVFKVANISFMVRLVVALVYRVFGHWFTVKLIMSIFRTL